MDPAREYIPDADRASDEENVTNNVLRRKAAQKSSVHKEQPWKKTYKAIPDELPTIGGIFDTPWYNNPENFAAEDSSATV